MEFSAKIDKILTAKKIKLWKLAKESGLNNTLEKAYTDNREMTDTLTHKFLENMGISKSWWESGKGAIFSIDTSEPETTNVGLSGRVQSPDYVLAFIDTIKELVLDKNNEVERMRQDRDKEIQRIQDEKTKLHSHIEGLIAQIGTSK